MQNLFIKLNVFQNENFDSFLSELSTLGYEYHFGVTELIFDTDEPLMRMLRPIYINFDESKKDKLSEFLKNHTKDICGLSVPNCSKVYTISHAEVTHEDETSRTVKIDENEVIAEFRTLKEAREVFDIISCVYTESRLIVLAKQFYEMDENGERYDDVPFYQEVIDAIE